VRGKADKVRMAEGTGIRRENLRVVGSAYMMITGCVS
jgi:hypothetical protein